MLNYSYSNFHRVEQLTRTFGYHLYLADILHLLIIISSLFRSNPYMFVYAEQRIWQNLRTRRFCRRVRIDFDQRPVVCLPRREDVIECGKKYHRSRHEDTEIHSLCRYRGRYWEEAKHKDYSAKDNGKDVDQYPKNPRKMERSPYQLIDLAGMFSNVFWRHNRSSQTPPEQKNFHDDVGSIQAADAKRHDIVESGGGADVDQPN